MMKNKMKKDKMKRAPFSDYEQGIADNKTFFNLIQKQRKDGKMPNKDIVKNIPSMGQ